MNWIASSGGLEFGRTGGPQIDIMPMPPRAGDGQDAVVERLFSILSSVPVQWYWVKDAPVNLNAWGFFPRTWAGIVGVSEKMFFRLMYPANQSVSDALRDIEASDDSLFPALCAAFLVADKCLRRGIDQKQSSIAIVIATRSLIATRPQKFPHKNRKEISALADQVFRLKNVSPDNDPFSRLNSYDLVRVMLEAGNLAWEPGYLHFDLVDTAMIDTRGAFDSQIEEAIAMGDVSSLARPFLRNTGAAMLVYDFAIVSALTTPDLRVTVAGTLLQVDPRATPTAYLQMREMVQQKVDPDSLKALLPGATLAGGEMDDYDIPDPALLAGITGGLLRDAVEHASYTPPAGAFLLDWPPEILPGVINHLVVVAHPTHLWVGVYEITDKGADAPTAVLCWRPGRDMFKCLTIPPGVTVWVNLVLAALWRDMRVAGDEILPVIESTHPEGSPPKRAGRHRRGQTERNARILPGARRTVAYRRWGTDVERAEIQRRAHGVRGHLRQLPSTWERSAEAVGIAAEFGIIPPDGYTFVRPHVRGGKADSTITPEGVIPIKARGLATILSLLSNTHER